MILTSQWRSLTASVTTYCPKCYR